MNQQTLREPSREISISKKTEGLVVGGGSAGIGAALAPEHDSGTTAVDSATLRRRPVEAGALLDYFDATS